MKFNYENTDYIISKEYSFKDFTGQDLSLKEDMNDIVIYASCFSQEELDKEIFPKNMSGVTLIKCNLSNCKIPDGNTVIDCRQTRFKIQNDLRDWEVDVDDKPVKVIGEKHYIREGFSVDPLDIPETKLSSIKDIKKV